MLVRDAYYLVKPLIPRWLQIAMRRQYACRVLRQCNGTWPIDENAGRQPAGWTEWPEKKRFALVLTHDVDTARGQERTEALAALEERLGFRSSFNFVPLRYQVSQKLRDDLSRKCFEIGVHGLYHDGKYYSSEKEFLERAARINYYLREWNAVGFRAPSMLHRLDWFHQFNIQYDASTFDTDPFEPDSAGVGTIFPFTVNGVPGGAGYIELPYTLPQDFTMFILLQERTIDIWKRKLDWIVQKGGMALLNTHPDYMRFSPGAPGNEEYRSGLYEEFLRYVQERYAGQYWHALPRDVAGFWRRCRPPAEYRQEPLKKTA